MSLAQRRFAVLLTLVAVIALIAAASANAQMQCMGLGCPLPNLAPVEAKVFAAGQSQFFRLWGVKEGLGPLTTDGGCSRCHKSPVIGGGAARLLTFFGKTNTDGTFDQFWMGGPFLQPLSNGPFIPGGICTLPGEQVPAGATVEKRLTAPTFGLGLVDAIADQDILNQAAFELNNYQADGIHGMANMVLDYHTPQVLRPGRFGRKAQKATLLQQVAGAFAHDLGISNPLVGETMDDCPQGVCPFDPNCVDSLSQTTPNNTNTTSGGKGIFPISDFPRFLAPATPTQTGLPGEAIFLSVGCNECHLPSYQTPVQVFYDTDLNVPPTQFGPSPSLSNQPVNLYSDLLLHDMGKLNAGTFPAGTLITGQATQQQWRTTPLWGIQVRTVFWHTGKITYVGSAILQHSPDGTGEAAAVLGRYKALSPSDQMLVIQFVQSL
jgi:CxxC motif-containing protein (DUF1111 family)